MTRKHWLVKTEPDVFSFSDLMSAPRRTAGWDGVRNYQARNFLRDEMKRGDGVLVYHSNVGMAVVGEAEVAREGYPDPTQFEKGHDHFDPDSNPAEPRWFQVDVKAVRPLKHAVSLERMKTDKGLEGLGLLRRGNRLSVQPVSAAHFARILKLGETGE
jgi:predicted RNA-binding protein with PUA-like domain